MGAPDIVPSGAGQGAVNNTPDPFGLEYNDWEDPEVHGPCTGCHICLPWADKSHRQIRIARIVEVRRRRIAEGNDLTPSEVARQDRRYWP